MKTGFWKGLVLGVILSVLVFAGLTAADSMLDHKTLVTKATMASTTAQIGLDAQQIMTDMRTAFDFSSSPPQASQVANETTTELLYLQIRQNNMIIDRLDKLLEK